MSGLLQSVGINTPKLSILKPVFDVSSKSEERAKPQKLSVLAKATVTKTEKKKTGGIPSTFLMTAGLSTSVLGLLYSDADPLPSGGPAGIPGDASPEATPVPLTPEQGMAKTSVSAICSIKGDNYIRYLDANSGNIDMNSPAVRRGEICKQNASQHAAQNKFSEKQLADMIDENYKQIILNWQPSRHADIDVNSVRALSIVNIDEIVAEKAKTKKEHEDYNSKSDEVYNQTSGLSSIPAWFVSVYDRYYDIGSLKDEIDALSTQKGKLDKESRPSGDFDY